MIDKLTMFFEQKLSGPMEKLAQQRHLRAVRDGIVATLPLIIVGSFFLIIAMPPLPQDWEIYQFLNGNAASISYDNVYYDNLCDFWNWIQFS